MRFKKENPSLRKMFSIFYEKCSVMNVTVLLFFDQLGNFPGMELVYGTP